MSGKKKNLLIGLAVIIIAGGGYLLKKSTVEKIEYRKLAITKGDIAVSILATGTVQPENRLEIKPPVAGRADQVLVQEGQTVKKGQILAWMSSSERAAMIDAARSRGKEEMKKWEELYRATPVVAPISGTIILRSVESGQSFTNSEAILVMSDRLTVKAQVDETDIAKIKIKQPATITLDAYPNDKIPAVVDTIAYDAKTVNNVTTYLVDVLPDNTPEFMRSGMTANVNFEIENKTGILLIPNEAIRMKDGTAVVLTAGPDEKPIDTEIKTGITNGKVTEVIEGLTEDQIVLVEVQKDKKQASNFLNPMGGGRPKKK